MNEATQRKHGIKDFLEKESTVWVNELALRFNVSEMTIRRDLSELERMGVLKRIHGGAVKDISRSYEPPFSLRLNTSKEKKQLIAKEAINYVSEGDTIALDSGTTTIELARLLLDFSNLTIVTPSLHVAMMFLEHPTITVLLTGGNVRKREGSLVGDFARQMFSSLYFDTFFTSTAALSEDSGLTDYIVEDAFIKKLIMDHATRCIALMHSDKFGKTAFAQVCDLDCIDLMITDSAPYESLIKKLHDKNVETIIANEEGVSNELA